MKKLLSLLAFAAVLYYGWQHRDSLLHREPGSEVVVVNAADMGLLRVRVTVDGATVVREALASGERATLPIRPKHESDFQMDWQWERREGGASWRGGTITGDGAPSRTTLTVSADGSVMFQAAPLPAAGTR